MGLSDYTETARPPKISVKETPVPKGWERGFEQTGTGGTITTGPLTTEASPQLWADLLADWGIDPDTVEIVGDPTVKGWDSPVKGTKTGETIRLRSYTVKFRNKAAGAEAADLAPLLKLVRKRKKPAKQPPPADEASRAFLVLIADWQAGKGEGGGSEAFVERVTEAFANIRARLAELKRVGRGCDVVYLVGMGDLVEQCEGHYSSQAWTVDLTRREQIELVVDLLVELVDMIVTDGYRVVLTGVAGNHGENRNGSGKAFTTPEDNDDLMVIALAGKVFDGNPERYCNVSVFLPDQLSMSLDVCGVVSGFQHGHVGGTKVNIITKLSNWWTGQIVGGGPTANAQLLFTAHNHHFFMTEVSGRTHFGCPSMDGGSRWFTEATGKSSPPGFLTMVVGAACGPRGYDDLKVA